MRVSTPKSLVSGTAAVAMAAAALLASGPADAAMRFGGGGFHGGGFSGFRGGGFGGFHPGMGGFRPGFGGFRPGFGGFRRNVFVNRNVFVRGRGCWGGWCGGGFWPGFATGAVIGAAATYPYYGGYPYYGYGYDSGCWVYYGRRLVNICY